ncbi:hypothetical protein [Gracilimonas sp.]|nr:hypothetical protein [Gracilimonas sp.]
MYNVRLVVKRRSNLPETTWEVQQRALSEVIPMAGDPASPYALRAG